MSEYINKLQSEVLLLETLNRAAEESLKTLNRAAETQIWEIWRAAKACLLELQGPQVSKSLCFVQIMLYAFTTKDKRICLKLLNKQIAARAVSVWLPFL